MSEQMTCALCGEPMPAGEEMFKFHGYSGPCPKPPLPDAPAWEDDDPSTVPAGTGDTWSAPLRKPVAPSALQVAAEGRTPRKVWVVEYHDYESGGAYGVYATEDEANAAAARLNADEHEVAGYTVTEHELFDPLSAVRRKEDDDPQ